VIGDADLARIFKNQRVAVSAADPLKDIHVAEADLKLREADLGVAKESLTVKEQDYARYKELAVQNVASTRDLQRSEAEFKQAQAVVKQAQAALERARAVVESIRKQTAPDVAPSLPAPKK
jgi:multidrug resistance efflux pump